MCRMFKLILSVLCAVTALAAVSVTAFAASVNGISVSGSDLRPGDTFTVTLGVPAAEAADTASLRVEFDPSVFEVVTWTPNLTNGYYNSGDSFIALTSANATRAIDLSRGAEFTATLAVKRSASSGTYPIKLVSSSFSYVKDNGYEYVELWTPSVTDASVRIASSSSGTPTSSVTTSQTPVITTSSSAASQPAVSSANATASAAATTKTTTAKSDTDADTTIKPGETAAPPNDDDEDEDEVPVSGNVVISTDDDDDGETTSPAVPDKKSVSVTYKAALGGLPDGKIHISTRSAVFDRDTEIRLTGTGKADDSALKALRELGLGKHDHYAFDISLYDSAANKRMNTLTGGHIEFAIPVPKKLLSAVDDLDVYHISGGRAQRINSSIAFTNGQYRIEFSASDFSTYMIVDMTGELADFTQASIADTSGTGSGLNPHTGVTAAVTVPAALVGCALLSRKIIKKRKRTKTYVE